MKHYHYFVSYQYNNQNDHGFGQVSLLLREPIADPEQVDEVRKYITERYNYRGVVVLNFLLLKEETIQPEEPL